ncbi:MAG: hypothetical protein JSS89_12080 [Bacteroidetes bacterium]|nr:hypothetical protein [Bacteroidota bacterium]
MNSNEISAAAWPALPDGWLQTSIDKLPILQSLACPLLNGLTQEIVSEQHDRVRQFDGKVVAVDDEAIFISLSHMLMQWTKPEILSKGMITSEAATKCAHIQAAIAADTFRMCGWRNVYVIDALPDLKGKPDNELQVCIVFGRSRIEIFKSLMANALPGLSIVAYERYQYEIYKVRMATSLN